MAHESHPVKDHSADVQEYVASRPEPLPYYHGHGGADESGKKRFSVWVLVAVALVTAIVVGAAVGGGIGSQLGKHTSSRHEQQQQPTTTTVTVTATSSTQYATASGGLLKDYRAIAPTDIWTVPLDCEQGGTYDTTYRLDRPSYRFTTECGQGLGGGPIAALVAYRFEDCMEACALTNEAQQNLTCTAVTFHSLMQYSSMTGNCWLQNSTAWVWAQAFDGDYSKDLSAVARLVT